MYMLDTDTCSYILKQRPLSVKLRLEAAGSAGVAVSAIVAAELYYGAARHPSRAEIIRRSIDDFLSRLQVLPWNATMAYARVRFELERSGTSIGNIDILIGAHALEQGATLVTNNLRHFQRISGLACESWA
jgi:tRNA(fMet)-specific endonuclease VapC